VSLAKVIQVVASSPNSWQEAIDEGVKRASKTVRNIGAIHIESWNAKVRQGKIVEYRAVINIAFEVEKVRG
jgi:hypothetical protein